MPWHFHTRDSGGRRRQADRPGRQNQHRLPQHDYRRDRLHRRRRQPHPRAIKNHTNLLSTFTPADDNLLHLHKMTVLVDS
jgi:hypothetical protein